MNKSRIAALILIVSVVAGLGFYISKITFGDKQLKPVNVPTAQPISATIEQQPSAAVFNAQAINPTVKINISDNNQSPIGN